MILVVEDRNGASSPVFTAPKESVTSAAQYSVPYSVEWPPIDRPSPSVLERPAILHGRPISKTDAIYLFI